ncbi:VWA domain-containing protein [Nocardioides sp.]|uniref:VWA domain-containing protein n=1 Tax=Nocardioides sp. TaxID=35761 RepID=UPI00351771FB
MSHHFPFTAVVGADDPDAPDPMALALLLNAISPEVGGVLVRGEKGTAKSTVVRALAAVLPPIDVVAGDRFSSDPREASPLSPDAPFPADAGVETRPVRLVELPVGATEDRVLGSLHLERALSEGRAEYEPGLLAKAHRGLLYVDEVNLLHDHLVDLLLDAAATGRATVERDGVSVEHAARFVLVGTMNPEEGELRPQLLDRFGLTVEVAAPREVALRAEVVRRRMAFDADPAAFAARYAPSEEALRSRIVTAREHLASVRLSDAALAKVAEVCAAFDVDGLRADIVTARTAVAHAAWCGRDEVGTDDIRVAARLALPHRRRRQPFDAPGLDEQLLDEVLGDDLPPEPPQPPEPGPAGGGDGGETSPRDADPTPDRSAPDSGGADSSADEPAPAPAPSPAESPAASGAETTAADQPGSTDSAAGGPSGAPLASAGTPFRARTLTARGLGAGSAGRRSRARTSNGRRVGAAAPGSGVEEGGGLHLVETIRAAAPHQQARGRVVGSPLVLRGSDLRRAVREGRETNLVLFCVDASGSMAARRRMEQVKTAVLSLLLDAYQRRDKVGMISFGGAEARLALPPTHSVDVAAARLDELPAGGRTPLAEGLLEARRVLAVERLRDPRRRALLVVVTDGRATAGPDAIARSQSAAEHLAADGTSSVVVDCEAGPMRLGLAARLAVHLGAEHLPLGEVDAQALLDVARRPGRAA